jgi:hypothetical protein
VVAVLVGKQDAVEVFAIEAHEGEAADDLSGTQTGVDQDVRFFA